MKTYRLPILQTILFVFLYNITFSAPHMVGFSLPDSVTEMRLKYRSIKNLIVIPVIINDSVKVNLILDTGCTNLVLFGKRFQMLLKINSNKQVVFSGLGSGNPVKGYLSLDNNVSIKSVQGKRVAVVVVPDKNLFSEYKDVHGVIGYDIFLKFEIEINSKTQTISFRPARSATPPIGYVKIPLLRYFFWSKRKHFLRLDDRYRISIGFVVKDHRHHKISSCS